MTKAQADKEADKIFKEVIKKCDEAEKKAKAEGVWRPGLDANKKIFEPIHREAKEKLRLLAEMIDDE